jgi:hypothetical protein
VVEVHLPDIDRGDPAVRSVKPPGWFIHELTAITDIAPRMPLTAIGTPDHQ